MLEKIKALTIWHWIAVVGLALFVVFLPALIPWIWGEQVNVDSYQWSPWHNAYEVSQKISIEVFASGSEGLETYLANRIMSLLGVIIFLIVGPGLLLLYGYEDDDSASDRRPVSNGFLFGMILTLAAFINLGGEYTVMKMVYENTRESAAVSQHKDWMRQDIASIGFASYEYYVLPDRLGGGNGSFEGITFDNILSHLDIEDPFNFTREHYSLEVRSDTLLEIRGRKVVKHNSNSDTVRLVAWMSPENLLTWK